jgi:hypothetical protein
MKTTIKVERFAVGGMVLVAKREIDPAARETERAIAKALLDDCYCQQPGHDALRVTIDGMVITHLGVRSTEHIESLYRAVRDGAALAA